MKRRRNDRSRQIVIRSREGYLDVVATAQAVRVELLHDLVDAIGNVIDVTPGKFVPILLEVIAPEPDLDLIEAMEVWGRAAQKGIQRTQIAYVVTGRSIGPLAKIMETVAINRGILLRFFEDRASALQWLCPGASSTAPNRTA